MLGVADAAAVDLQEVVRADEVKDKDAFEEKRAINTLIGDDPIPPNGGAGFHDPAVWLQRA